MYPYALLTLAVVAEANPLLAARQGVTADISPAAPAPPGCSGSVSYSFGVVARNISSPAVAKRQATQISDGQVQAATASPAVSQITDGQIQAATGAVNAVSQITDGQIQAATAAPKILTVAPISIITDGQIQAGLHTMNIMPVAAPSMVSVAPVSQISDGQLQVPVEAASQITDGQVQAPATTTMMPVTESKDGQPVAPTAPAQNNTAPAISEQGDGQPIATTSPTAAASPASSAPAASSSSPSASSPSSDNSRTTMKTCKSDFSITLDGTKLTDQLGRTGYIASNFQFQFDNPPQAGALYTSGFSICENGTLALGGTNIFYQCLSGNFYNIYDRKWAAQCSPAFVETMEQIDC